MGLLDWLLDKDNVPELIFREDPSTGVIVVERRSPGMAQKPSHPINDARWHPTGERVTIQGITIRSGLIYTGTSLQSDDPYGTYRREPSLIIPALDSAREPSKEPLLYWRSYADLSPAQRTTYLTWLASGRSDPDADIHYVYLFFFGLERRVVTDLVDGPNTQTELLEIRDEVTRLLALYADGSIAFRDDATMLLEIIDMLLPPSAISNPPPPPSLTEKGWEIPLSLRVRIGQFAANGTPISPDWALAWVWYYPETRLLTPALRCTPEFARLFARRYSNAYGHGLKVRPGKGRIRGVYRPANFSLGPVPLAMNKVPNTFEHKSPIRKLQEIFTRTSADLNAYSRWIGRNPDHKDTLPAVAQLPAELIDATAPASEAFLKWSAIHLERSDPARVDGGDVVSLWAPNTSKLTKAQSTAFLELAQHLGVGMEPDVRFGGSPLATGDAVVIFRMPPDAPTSTTSAYDAATLLVHLAAAVAVADGAISRTEVGHLGTWVATHLHLSPAEQTRLFVHLFRLAATEIKLTGIKKRIDSLDDEQRGAIGDVLIAIAASDGAVAPQEVRALIKIFRLLGLDLDSVTNRIHTTLAIGGLTPTKPSKSAPAESRDYALDPAAIARIQADTAAVSSLLSDIFVDEEPVSPAPEPTPESGSDEIVFQNLDLPHAQFLEALLSQESWPRAEYEDLASRFHVMPGGAIDVINDVAFDIIGDPVIEGDDILTIHIDLIEELKV